MSYQIKHPTTIVLLTILLIFGLTSCQSPPDNAIGVTVEIVPTVENREEETEPAAPTAAPPQSGYPIFADGYPMPSQVIPEGAVSELPNPERTIPAPTDNLSSLGGVLVREVGESSFLPVMPQTLYLGEVLLDDAGRQSVIVRRTDSPTAQLFPTGVFVFNNVPAKTYGLIVDIALSEFPVTLENGDPLLIDVKAGEAIDLGAVLVNLP